VVGVACGSDVGALDDARTEGGVDQGCQLHHAAVS
jgi:hypothetical protein